MTLAIPTAITQTLNPESRPPKAKSVVLLWLWGAPSHIDTWDPKPDHRNGGGTKGIDTAGGFQIAEHYPGVAKETKAACVVRSLTSPEGDHSRGSYLMHTGYARRPGGSHPQMGSWAQYFLGGDLSEHM